MRGHDRKGPGQLVKGLEGDAAQRTPGADSLDGGRQRRQQRPCSTGDTPQRFHQLREAMQAALQRWHCGQGGQQTLAHQEQRCLAAGKTNACGRLKASKLREEVPWSCPAAASRLRAKNPHR